MRLTLPISDQEKQTLMQNAARALQFGRLHAVREESRGDGTHLVSAKFTDSFGFVDHPRLTTRQPGGELVDFRCNCNDFHNTGRLCCHCMALADTYFDELFTFHAAVQAEAPMEAPAAPLVFQETLSPSPVEQISYRFCNCRQDLYPGKSDPRIPLVRYQQMFGKNAMARMLYHMYPKWGGSCFGFTTTASMFILPDDPISAPDFRTDAAYPADLPLTSRSSQLHMTLHTFIECMQISQYHSMIQIPLNDHIRDPDCLNTLCEQVLHFQQTKTAPVCMSVYRSEKFDGGHSVFPYWLEINDNGQDRLHIYDPNHPMTTRYAYLDKDENGHYTNWRFPMFDHLEYSSATGGQIAFNAYEDFKPVWDGRGGELSVAMMSVPRKVAIANSDGELLFRVTAEGTESFCDDIRQVLLTDVGDEANAQVLLHLPAGKYLVRSEDPQRESMQIMLTHTQQSITIRTDASEAEIQADDANMTVCARIAQRNRSYGIELDAVYENESRAILLEGTTAEDGLCFGCYHGILQAEGTLSEEQACLYIDEELSDLSCIALQQPEIINQEPVVQKQRILLVNSELPEEAPASDATD